MKTPKELITYKGEDKQIIRQRIAEKINEEYRKDPTTSYMELYGAGESFKYIKKHTKAKILSIDNNPKIGRRMKGITGTREISIQELCEEGTSKFNIIWLDYCSTLNNEVIEDLIMLENIMKNKGTLYITLAMGRERQYDKETPRTQMELGIISTIYLSLMQNLIKTEWQCTAKYKSRAETQKKRKTNRGTPMKVYKFNWERVKKTINTMQLPNNELLSLASNL